MTKTLTAENTGLKIKIEALDRELKSALERNRALGAELSLERDTVKQKQKQFDDLKERLSNSESENQRMRGYISRVQEDDVVREELVATGDPDGEKVLVPKRKPTQFNQPNQSSNTGEFDENFTYRTDGERRRKPKHWVTY